MSALLKDDDIWVVKLALKKKDGSGTSTYYFSDSYFVASAIYSGSPEVFPLLAEPIAARRGVGAQVAIRYSTTIRFFGKTPIDKIGATLHDLKLTHEFHGAVVEIRWYNKPSSAATTHSDDVNIRQTLTCVGFQYIENDIIEINCNDSWYVNKEYSRVLRALEFDGLSPDADGQYGQYVFGEGVLVDAPMVTAEFVANESTFAIFLSFCSVDSENSTNGENQIYVMNPDKQKDSRDWLPMGGSGRSISCGANSGTEGSVANIRAAGVAFATEDFNPDGEALAEIITKVRCRCKKTGSPAASSGEMKLSIYYNQHSGGAASAAPLGSALRQTTKDVSQLTTSWAWIDFQLESPLVMLPGVEYLAVWEWTGEDLTTNFPYISIANGGGTSNADSYSQTDGASFAASNDVWMEIFGYEEDGLVNTEIANGVYYDSVYFSAEAADLFTGETAVLETKNLKFKVNLDGIRDDSPPEFQAVGNATLTNWSHILEFILTDSVHGLGLSYVDTSSFDAAATLLDNKSLDLAFAVDRKTTVDDIVVDGCLQTGTILYKSRKGNLKLHYPETMDGTFDYDISEAKLLSDMKFLGVSDLSHDNVVNDFEVQYSKSETEVSKDPAVIRRSSADQYTGVYKLNSASSSDDDTSREAACAASVALYGKREFRHNFGKLATGAAAIDRVKWYCDNYATLPKRLVFEVPISVFGDADLFDKVRCRSFSLPSPIGTSELIRGSDTGDTLLVYDEGVPTHIVSTGAFEGQIKEIAEQGSYIYIYVDTVNSFVNA